MKKQWHCHYYQLYLFLVKIDFIKEISNLPSSFQKCRNGQILTFKMIRVGNTVQCTTSLSSGQQPLLRHPNGNFAAVAFLRKIMRHSPPSNQNFTFHGDVQRNYWLQRFHAYLWRRPLKGHFLAVGTWLPWMKCSVWRKYHRHSETIGPWKFRIRKYPHRKYHRRIRM